MSTKTVRLILPVRDPRALSRVTPGDTVLLSGELYVFRDQAHRRIAAGTFGELGGRDLSGAGVYYCAPTPAKAGMPVGACGPTSSYRMDGLTEPVLALGFRVMVGKGHRGDSVRALCRKYRAVYLITWGGCGALLAGHVRAARTVAFRDLGTEAIRVFAVEDFPVVVGIDVRGAALSTCRPRRLKGVSDES